MPWQSLLFVIPVKTGIQSSPATFLLGAVPIFLSADVVTGIKTFNIMLDM